MLIPIRNSLSVCPAETNKIEACLYTDFPLDFPLKHTKFAKIHEDAWGRIKYIDFRIIPWYIRLLGLYEDASGHVRYISSDKYKLSELIFYHKILEKLAGIYPHLP